MARASVLAGATSSPLPLTPSGIAATPRSSSAAGRKCDAARERNPDRHRIGSVGSGEARPRKAPATPVRRPADRLGARGFAHGRKGPRIFLPAGSGGRGAGSVRERRPAPRLRFGSAVEQGGYAAATRWQRSAEQLAV